MFKKFTVYILISLVSIVGISFPIVKSPEKWYEFPNIPGLEENAKIIFFHVPLSWLAVLAFLMSTYFSIRYLRKKDFTDDLKSYTSAQLGLIFCILATVTGSVWAKLAWGSFWNWDPRETSIFAILLIYGAYFALRSSLDNEEKRATLAAVYSCIAFITVPFFVFIMPRIMTGLHPGSADDSTSGPVVSFKMNMNMRVVFFVSLGAFTLLYSWLWSLGYRALLLKEKFLKSQEGLEQ
ncbi:MAG: cytochrome c biogenesis protein [Ignavibacteria bacterium]|nr:cytochrome c biogenesis protein [Ignavibacteria bacterium]